jgi:hypothetical protein
LNIHINHLTILINSASQVMLLAVNFDEYLIDVERIAIASVPPLKSSSVQGVKFYAPEAD